MSYIWIVEMWSFRRDRWEPTVGCALRKGDSLDEKKRWKERNPFDRFRVARYERKRNERTDQV